MHSTDEVVRRRLLRRGLWLEYATLGWNLVGVVVLVFAAVAARSVALAGFGLDSLIEIGASVVVVWELSGTGAGRQRRALRLIGVGSGCSRCTWRGSPPLCWSPDSTRGTAGPGSPGLRSPRGDVRPRDGQSPDRHRVAAAGIQPLKIPPRAPKANAYAERWVRTVRTECLDWMLVWSRGHLRRVLDDYVRHYNAARPHRGIDLDVPVPPVDLARARTDRVGRVERVDVLGGLINEYERAA